MSNQGNPRHRQFLPRGVAVCAALVAAGAVRAETPLSLLVSETLTYESNLLRDNANKYRDATSSTLVQGGFNKEYGRQTYKATGAAIANRYKNSKQYDNDGYSVALGFTSEIASNWFVSLDHSRLSRMQGFQDQGLNRFKETIESQQTQFFGQYGLHGRWSANATLSTEEADYDIQNNDDRTSRSAKLGIRYSPTDLLYFDLGYRRMNSHLPNYRSSLTSDDGERIKRNSIELSTRWIVTGYSNLDGRIGWTQERYTMDEQRDFNGLTGRVSWNYTPSGKMSYSVALDRDTNNAGGYTSLLGFSLSEGLVLGLNNQKRISTGLSLRATYSATAKISLTASGIYSRIEEESSSIARNESTQINGPSVSNRLTGTYRSLNIGANYQLFKSTQLSCSLEKYDRTASLFSKEFSGESLSCAASFAID